MRNVIFIKRAGRSTLAVRVFRSRPWKIKAARGMRRAGIAEATICSMLGIGRARLKKDFGPHAFFKL